MPSRKTVVKAAAPAPSAAGLTMGKIDTTIEDPNVKFIALKDEDIERIATAMLKALAAALGKAAKK